jgi:hypothetical protein
LRKQTCERCKQQHHSQQDHGSFEHMSSLKMMKKNGHQPIWNERYQLLF